MPVRLAVEWRDRNCRALLSKVVEAIARLPLHAALGTAISMNGGLFAG